jgi:Fe-S cluster assembly iron-binding protein IscA
MLTVTKAAYAHLAQLLDEAEGAKGIAVRYVIDKNGFTMRFDQPRSDDTTFEHGGQAVLALDEQVSRALAHKTLDVKQTVGGAVLGLR